MGLRQPRIHRRIAGEGAALVIPWREHDDLDIRQGSAAGVRNGSGEPGAPVFEGKDVVLIPSFFGNLQQG